MNEDRSRNESCTRTKYTYDSVSDSSCNQNPPSIGDLVKKTDAVGNVTCYAYDAMHRLTDLTYPSGSYSSVTDSRHFIYDSATVNGTAMTKVKGRLAEAYTGPLASKKTDLGYSYSARGEISDVYQKTPNSGGYYHLTATYWAHGALNQVSGFPGTFPNLYYGAGDGSGVDGEGRVVGVTASSGQNPLSTANQVAYDSNTGVINRVTYGSLDYDTFEYDPNTLRMTKYTGVLVSPGKTDSQTLTWNSDGSLQKLVIADQLNSNNSQTCTFSNDDLGRIAGVNCGTVWSQTFGPDVFGNLIKYGSQPFTPGYNTATNQINSYYSTTYDSNGNMTNDGITLSPMGFTWNTDNNPITISRSGTTVTIVYDALGRAVENQSLTLGVTVNTEILYGPGGSKLALMSGQTVSKAFVPLPGGGQAVYSGTAVSYYRHPDWLGSSRLASSATQSQTPYFDTFYGPYGENNTSVAMGTTDLDFTGQNEDTIPGLYDFMFRRYHPGQGRWISPDPGGMAAVTPENPQSWNRYAYVMNRPLNSVDPDGLDGGPDFSGCGTDPLCYQSRANDYAHQFSGNNCAPLHCEVDPIGMELYGINGLPGIFGGGIQLPGGGFGDGDMPYIPPTIPSGVSIPGVIQAILTGNWKPLTPPIPGIDTVGMDVEKQTSIGDCIKQNAKTYSIAGIVSLATNRDNNWIVDQLGDNEILSTAIDISELDPKLLAKGAFGAGMKLSGAKVPASGAFVRKYLGSGTSHFLSRLNTLKKAVDLGLTGALAADCALGWLK